LRFARAEQLHAFAHQVANILLGHQAAANDASHLFPNLDPALTISRNSQADEAITDEFASRHPRPRLSQPEEPCGYVGSHNTRTEPHLRAPRLFYVNVERVRPASRRTGGAPLH
jgi:hypothetical protein